MRLVLKYLVIFLSSFKDVPHGLAQRCPESVIISSMASMPRAQRVADRIHLQLAFRPGWVRTSEGLLEQRQSLNQFDQPGRLIFLWLRLQKIFQIVLQCILTCSQLTSSSDNKTILSVSLDSHEKTMRFWWKICDLLNKCLWARLNFFIKAKYACMLGPRDLVT